MAKTGIWALVFLAIGVAALASLGPGVLSSGGRTEAGQASLLRAVAAVAATVPTAVNGVIDESVPSPTPSATATGVPQPLVRTVQIAAYNDASVASGGQWSSDTNLGGWSKLATGPHPGGTFRSYLRFLVAGLPAGMQIDSAVLILMPLDGGARPVPVEADFVQDDWNESTITWNQQPLSTYRTGTSTWQPGSGAPLGIDVTSATQQWYACGGTSNNGLLLSADLASDYVDFGSRKSDAPPVLQVTYQTATAPVNCAAPPTSNVNLAPPTGITSSTTGAQLGSVNPNDINNPNLLLSGTPLGRFVVPRAPQPPYPNQPTSSALPPVPYSTPPIAGPPAVPVGSGGG